MEQVASQTGLYKKTLALRQTNKLDFLFKKKSGGSKPVFALDQKLSWKFLWACQEP